MYPALVKLLAEGGGGNVPFMQQQLYLTIWTWVWFAALFLILYKGAWPKILKAMEEREQRIQKRFDESAARVDAAEKKAAEYEGRIRDIEDEGRKVIGRAREDAQRTAADVETKAKDEVERMVERARREINLARDAAADDLKREVVEMAVEIVEKVLEEQVSEDEHRRFVDDCIGKYENLKL